MVQFYVQHMLQHRLFCWGYRVQGRGPGILGGVSLGSVSPRSYLGTICGGLGPGPEAGHFGCQFVWVLRHPVANRGPATSVVACSGAL